MKEEDQNSKDLEGKKRKQVICRMAKFEVPQAFEQENGLDMQTQLVLMVCVFCAERTLPEARS